MSFNLENPCFSVAPDGDPLELPRPVLPSLQSSSGSSPSAPSSGGILLVLVPREDEYRFP